MSTERLEIDLTESEQLSLIRLTFGINKDVYDGVLADHSDHLERIRMLVLSEAVGRLLLDAVNTYESVDNELKDKENGDE